MTSPAAKDNQSSGSRKAASASASSNPTKPPPPDQALRCPRCDSSNTKFCYYNNYSLTQPRHFCKTCRRYWTKGGALRNVPVGGGCRKTKKQLKSSTNPSRLASADSKLEDRFFFSGNNSLPSPPSPSELATGFKLFHGLAPAIDFQLGTLSTNFPRVHGPISGIYGNYSHQNRHQPLSSFAEVAAPATDHASSPCNFSLDVIPSASSGGVLTPTPLMGFNNYSSLPSFLPNNNNSVSSFQETSSMKIDSNLASSIESLSSINQDLHWKLQQQRLATMLFGGESQKDRDGDVVLPVHAEEQTQIGRQQPISVQSLEGGSKQDDRHQQAFISGDGGGSRKQGSSSSPSVMTEWYFGNSYASVTTSPTESSSNGNENNGVWTPNKIAPFHVHDQAQHQHQAWGRDLQHQYNALP